MAEYAIGDLQGCYKEFQALLGKINFRESLDTLWLAGDLVNRGPDSLSCLREAKRLNAKIVLGNHDLHLLACYYSKHSLRKKDSLDEILQADDCHELMEWLRKQPLIQVDHDRNLVMSHAGLPHIWSVAEAVDRATEVQMVLSGSDEGLREQYFDQMYGNQPACWQKKLEGFDRLRVITNYFTRMRFVNNEGELELSAKEGLDKTPDGFAPWFSFKRPDNYQVVFGHWAALEGKTGREGFHAIDTGCVWGGALTAMNLDTFQLTSIEAE